MTTKRKGDILKELRLKAGLEQKELALKIGVSSSTIGMIERNERKGGKVVTQKIADFFRITVDELEGKQAKADKVSQLFKLLLQEGIIDDINNTTPEIDKLIISTAKQQFLEFKEEEEFKAKLKDR